MLTNIRVSRHQKKLDAAAALEATAESGHSVGNTSQAGNSSGNASRVSINTTVTTNANANGNAIPATPPPLPLLFQAFSLSGANGTWNKLWQVDSSVRRPTDSLNGMRVLAMLWIIVGHSFMMPGAISAYSNQLDLAQTPLTSCNSAEENSALFMVVVSGQAGVDTYEY